jgi:hypothetical protein
MMVMVMKWGEWKGGADGQWVSVSGKFPLLSNFSDFVLLGGCSRDIGLMQAGCSRAAGRSWGIWMKLGFR